METSKWRLVQFHTDLISQKDNSYLSKYYESIWEQEYYHKPDAFWELPKWVAEVSYCLKKAGKSHDMQVFRSDTPIELNADNVFGSVLDSNKHLFRRLIESNPNVTFLLGGYINPAELEYDNVFWFESVEKCMNYIRIPYERGVDWSLFAGEKCIPRITLSYGCKHKCKFCTIPDEVIPVSHNEIYKQVLALRPLKFNLVYIDDKTFGQCKNYNQLRTIYYSIRSFNPDFVGFVVQTTSGMVRGINWGDLHVYAAEIGVETYNDSILKELRKPSSVTMVNEAERLLKDFGIKYIPNIVVGFQQETKETYSNTFCYLASANILYANLNNLAIYNNTDLADEIDFGVGDQNEGKSYKSYNTDEKNKIDAYAIESMAQMLLVKNKL